MYSKGCGIGRISDYVIFEGGLGNEFDGVPYLIDASVFTRTYVRIS